MIVTWWYALNLLIFVCAAMDAPGQKLELCLIISLIHSLNPGTLSCSTVIIYDWANGVQNGILKES
jgi:hypothetical protein